MKKLGILMFIVVLAGCTEDEIKKPEAPIDYGNFLNTKVPQINADVNDQSIHWEFGWQTYQMGCGAICPKGPEDPHRMVEFWLTQENGDNRFVISSPEYDASSPEAFDRVFGLGEKSLGHLGEDFNLQFRMNGSYYRTCEVDPEYKIEILKTRELVNTSLPTLRVWFVIKHVKAVNCASVDKFEIGNARIIAEFVGYKK